MRLDQLEYFYALSSLKTIQAVSEAFYTSPQVVSKAIKQLEEELNALLFVRTRKGLSLTEAGIDIYPHVAEMLENYQYLKNNYIENNALRIQDLKILSSKGTIFYFSQLIKELDLATPTKHQNLIMKIATVQEIRQIIYHENDYDIIATILDDQEINILAKELFISRNYEINIMHREPLKIYMHKKSQWADKQKISYKQFKNLSFIRYNLADVSLESFLKESYNIKLSYPYQVNEITLAMELVKKNQGCFFAPEYYISSVFPVTERKDIVAMDLDINFYQSVVFLINKDRLQDSAFLSVIETLKRE